jgi:hypothetical protein
MAGAIAGPKKARKAHSANDQPPRTRAQDRHPDGGSSAERIAAEIVILEGEMSDQSQPVLGKYVRRIRGQIVGLRAAPMSAQIRHNRPEAPLRQLGGMAEPDPVGVGVGEQTVQEKYRAALAKLVPDELRPVGGGESVGADGHSDALRVRTHYRQWPGSPGSGAVERRP